MNHWHPRAVPPQPVMHNVHVHNDAVLAVQRQITLMPAIQVSQTKSTGAHMLRAPH